MLGSSRGQATVETVYLLPVLLGLLTFVAGSLHSLASYYLADHWVYQGALCMAHENPVSECRDEVEKHLNSLPYTHFKIKRFSRNDYQSEALVTVHTPVSGTLRFQESFSLPLRSKQFGHAQ